MMKRLERHWLREILYQSYLRGKSFSIIHKWWKDLSRTDWEQYCINPPTSERNFSASPTNSERTWAALTERNIVSILPQREIFQHHPQMVRRLERHWLREILHQSYLREKSFSITHKWWEDLSGTEWKKYCINPTSERNLSASPTHSEKTWASLTERNIVSILPRREIFQHHPQIVRRLERHWLREILYQSYLGEKSFSITHKQWEDLSGIDWEKYCINPTSERNHSASPTHSEKTWAALTERNIVSILPQREIFQHHQHIVRRFERHWLREILYQSYLREKSFSITHKRCQWLREILYQSYLGEKSFSITHKRCQWLREILYQSSYLREKLFSITHK